MPYRGGISHACMSRFYNALKEASRFQPLETPEVETRDSPVAPPDLNPQPEGKSASPADRAEAQDKFSLGDEQNRVATAAPAFFGCHADVILDQTARLIPHAVDQAVVEHYRRLRTKIMQQHAVKPFRSLLV